MEEAELKEPEHYQADVARLLHELYYNKHYTSKAELYRQANKAKPVTHSIVNKFVDAQLPQELHYRAVRKIPRAITAHDKHEQWHADLIDLSKFKYQNSYHAWLMTVINIFSRKAYGRAMKTKGAVDVATAFGSIITEAGYAPRLLQTDNGTEWLNKQVQDLLREHGIIHRTVQVGDHHKQGVIERFNGTIMGKIARNMSANKTKNWVNYLPSILDSYNNSYHRTIKMTPNEADSEENEDEVADLWQIKREDTALEEALAKPIQVGSYVRIPVVKNIFEKGYSPSWSKEVYRVIDSHGGPDAKRLYKLQDTVSHQPLDRWYKLEEVQPVAPQRPLQSVEESIRAKKHEPSKPRQIEPRARQPRRAKETEARKAYIEHKFE